jgi:hypothetical protein
LLWRWGKLPQSFITILHRTHLGHMLSTSTSQIPLLGSSAGLCGSQMSLQKLIEMYMEFSTQTTLFQTRLEKKEKKGSDIHWRDYTIYIRTVWVVCLLLYMHLSRLRLFERI